MALTVAGALTPLPDVVPRVKSIMGAGSDGFENCAAGIGDVMRVPPVEAARSGPTVMRLSDMRTVAAATLAATEAVDDFTWPAGTVVGRALETPALATPVYGCGTLAVL